MFSVKQNKKGEKSDDVVKFELYRTVLRFLAYKVTPNLRKIFLDVYMKERKVFLTAIYEQTPSDLELELLDDIETNSDAHMPDFFVDSTYKLSKDYHIGESHEFIVFAVYEDYQ